MSEAEYRPTKRDLERLAELASAKLTIHESNEDYHDEAETQNAEDLLRELGQVLFSGGGDAFASLVSQNSARIREAARYDEHVAEVLVLGYKLGISADSGACMNDLGALYYMGELVEQDYARAAELYEMAMAHGCYQSIVNLGYIYEYGRTGEKDLGKAYRYYALAAALAPSSEAVYKLGDMYSRGVTGERDVMKAKALWERSLELAHGLAEFAQPAIRIAKLLIDAGAVAQGVKRDPLRALHLFQQAEIGLRIDITENGMTYYQRRLEEAIEGQERARALVVMDDAVLH